MTGIVTMEGEPVTAGAVYLRPDAANSFRDDDPSGLLELDGSFVMKTFPFGEGVAPGKYKVTLGAEVANRIKKPEYAVAEKTPWEIVVTEEGILDYPFEVE